MATRTGINLLSALRRTGSTAALRDVQEVFFEEEDELAAFLWLRDHVSTYRAFPSPDLMRRRTGIQTVVVTQPLAFYLNEARQRALYNAVTPLYGDMRDAIESRNPDALVDLARQMINAGAQLANRSSDYIGIESALNMVVMDYDDAASHMGGIRGIPSGWDYVDEQTGGFLNDDLVSVVGRIGVGKTYVMLYLAYNSWRAGYNVLFNTNELGAVQLTRRLFGVHTKINPTLLRKGLLSTAVSRQIREMASGMLNGVPFNVVEGGFRKSVETVEAVADATSPDIIFSDSSYLLEAKKKRRGAESRYETVSDTIEDLKRMGLERRRPIVQSVQFNRTAERTQTRNDQTNNDPTAHLSLAKIGDTDVIGRASSIVLGLAKAFAPFEDTRRWARFLKGREGEGGRFQFNYSFSPVDFGIISIGDAPAAERPDVSHML